MGPRVPELGPWRKRPAAHLTWADAVRSLANVHRYRTGWDRRLHGAALMARRLGQNTWGSARHWPVHRAWVDHSVYAYDNQHLPSAWPRTAALIHAVSGPAPQTGCAVVEFEHPFALLGAPDLNTDLRAFQATLPARLNRFFSWFDARRHRLVGSSRRAVQWLGELAAAHGHSLPRDGAEVLRWGGLARRDAVATPQGGLRVFHYGGAYPYAKGTHDVLAVATGLPELCFELCVDPAHPLLHGALPANVIVHAHTDRRAYALAMDRCHVLLTPIYADGWGVILDAMARAMPVVTYGSYDKEEAVQAGQTGVVVPLPKELSYYDGMQAGDWANWTAFNAHVAAHASAARVAQLSDALRIYHLNHRLLVAHSRATAARYRALHHGPDRVARILSLYGELLGPEQTGLPPRAAAA